MPHHTTFVAGLKFRPGASEHLASLPEGAILELVRDPENAYDPNAVKVMSSDVHLGFIPATLAVEIGSLMVQGRVTETLKGDAKNKIRIYYTDEDAAEAEAA